MNPGGDAGGPKRGVAIEEVASVEGAMKEQGGQFLHVLSTFCGNNNLKSNDSHGMFLPRIFRRDGFNS